MAKSSGYKWEFKPRFRRHAFGWKSQPAIARVKAAVSEIRQVARTDATLAAGGAVLFLEKVSGALERVDSSSGAIGTAVGHAVSELAAVIAAAPAAPATRAAWLERLFDAHADDQIPYIERLADHWGELCASKDVASAWADRLIGITRMALSPDQDLRGYEITGADVWAAYSRTLEAAARAGDQETTRDRIRALVASEQQSGRFVTTILGATLGLPP